MALGFKMGASGEKPRTETYNVTENGTFDMGENNLYRYVNANVSGAKIKTGYHVSSFSGFSNTDTSKTRTLYIYKLITRDRYDNEYGHLSSVSNSSASIVVTQNAKFDYVAINVPIVENHFTFREALYSNSTSGKTTINYGWTANDISKLVILVQSGTSDQASSSIIKLENITSTSCVINHRSSENLDVQVIELP